MVAIKTSQEIAAIIKDVFPDARIQLCYWHVLRAMRSKLKSFAATKGHLYNPQEAKVLIPDLEICWGCRPEKRPAGHRHSEACGCRGKNANYSTPGRLEPMTVAERDKVIRAMCASEMYTLCRQKNSGGPGRTFGPNGTQLRSGNYGLVRHMLFCLCLKPR